MARPAIAWQDGLKILQKWYNDFPNELAGFYRILLKERTKRTYTSTYVVKVLEDGIRNLRGKK